MLTLVSIVEMEDRMKNKILIVLVLAISTSIHARKIISISQDTPYTFSMVSPHKKNPVTIHKQNEAYLHIRCKPRDSFKDSHYIHSCTIKVKSGAPEGTFALFKKTLKNNLKSLFHVSIER